MPPGQHRWQAHGVGTRRASCGARGIAPCRGPGRRLCGGVGRVGRRRRRPVGGGHRRRPRRCPALMRRGAVVWVDLEPAREPRRTSAAGGRRRSRRKGRLRAGRLRRRPSRRSVDVGSDRCRRTSSSSSMLRCACISVSETPAVCSYTGNICAVFGKHRASILSPVLNLGERTTDGRERGRYRVGADGDGAGAVHDTRPGAVLRGHGAGQERARHAHAEHLRHGPAGGAVGGPGVQPGVR